MARPCVIPLLLLALAACGSSGPARETTPEPLPDPDDPAYAESFDGTVDERVSTSRGEEGGVVVLWPRVVSSGVDEVPETSEVQSQLRAIAERAAEGRPVDVRPEPQRVCPQGGCEAAAVGAVVLRADTGCAVVATASLPGPTPARLVPWAGQVELAEHNVPFREPPEQHIRVTDFVPCSDLATALYSVEPEIEQAVREVIRE